jgi:hypothetical protein
VPGIRCDRRGDDVQVRRIADNLIRDGYVDNDGDAMWLALLITAAAEAREEPGDPATDRLIS